MFKAINADNPAEVKQLLDDGIDANSRSDGFTALHMSPPSPRLSGHFSSFLFYIKPPPSSTCFELSSIS